jgi:flagellar biosynthesis/type III secretory pathway protein FliH
MDENITKDVIMDKQRIIELAKARGLEVLEKTAGELGQLAIDIVGEVIKETPNQIDDLVWMALEKSAREQMEKLVDKIDGQVG